MSLGATPISNDYEVTLAELHAYTKQLEQDIADHHKPSATLEKDIASAEARLNPSGGSSAPTGPATTIAHHEGATTTGPTAVDPGVILASPELSASALTSKTGLETLPFPLGAGAVAIENLENAGKAVGTVNSSIGKELEQAPEKAAGALAGDLLKLVEEAGADVVKGLCSMPYSSAAPQLLFITGLGRVTGKHPWHAAAKGAAKSAVARGGPGVEMSYESENRAFGPTPREPRYPQLPGGGFSPAPGVNMYPSRSGNWGRPILTVPYAIPSHPAPLFTVHPHTRPEWS